MIGKHTMVTKVVRDIESGELLSRRLRWTDLPFARAMGVRFPAIGSNTFVGPLPANATETVICTVGPLNLPIDNAQVLLFWYCSLTAGASSTFSQFNLRRGTSSAGTRLNANNWQTAVVAANPFIASGCYVDSPGLAAEFSYVLTIVQGAATGAGTLPDVALMAMVL